MFKRFGLVAAAGLLVASLGTGAALALPGSGSLDREDDIEFTGTLESMPDGGMTGTWTVEGMDVMVTADTELDEGLTIGASVKVEGSFAEGGAVIAREIEDAVDEAEVEDEDVDNSGPGNAADRPEDEADVEDEDVDNSGPGNAADRPADFEAHADNSGPGNAADRPEDEAEVEDEDVDNSGPGNAADRPADFEARADNSGPGNAMARPEDNIEDEDEVEIENEDVDNSGPGNARDR